MYLQEILEVAIGLVFMWLVMSIADMQLQDWIASIFNWRAKALERTIREMLGGSKALAEQIYSHPLIASLYRSHQGKRRIRLPSYLPSDKFAMALFDLAMTAGTEASPLRRIFKDVHAQLDQLQNDPERLKLAQEDWVAILGAARQIASSQLTQAAIDSLKLQIHIYAEKYPELQEAIELALPQLDAYFQTLTADQRAAEAAGQTDQTLRLIRLGVLAIQDASPELKTTLTTLLQNAEAAVDKGEQAVAAARTNIETWFNNAMERLSGAYKRRAQLVAFIIGVILAAIFNVDSIYMASSLWREPTLRHAIVAQAEAYSISTAPATSQDGTPTPRETIADLQEQLSVLSFPFGWRTDPFDTGGKQCTLLPLNENQVFGFPSQDARGAPICKRISNFPIDLPGWASKILGILISGGAAAQGAPFWFDILRKMVQAREMVTRKQD
ncbi:MAG: hypothetical protein ABWK53_02175 [Anaerolineales bacterium]